MLYLNMGSVNVIQLHNLLCPSIQHPLNLSYHSTHHLNIHQAPSCLQLRSRHNTGRRVSCVLN